MFCVFNIVYNYHPLTSLPPLSQNHMVEGMWVEVNNRVKYPLKEPLVQLQDQEALNMDDNIVRYCTSNLTAELWKIGIRSAALAWNEHRISGEYQNNTSSYAFLKFAFILKLKVTFKKMTFCPLCFCLTGKGIPNHLAAGGCPKKIGAEMLPHAHQAADMYQQDAGSSLTRVSCFRTDPFSMEDEKYLLSNVLLKSTEIFHLY